MYTNNNKMQCSISNLTRREDFRLGERKGNLMVSSFRTRSLIRPRPPPGLVSGREAPGGTYIASHATSCLPSQETRLPDFSLSGDETAGLRGKWKPQHIGHICSNARVPQSP